MSGDLALSQTAGAIAVANSWIIRQQFGAATRRRFYEALAVMLNNNVLLVKALEAVQEVASEEGRKPNRVQAVVARDLIEQLSSGSTFAGALAAWVNPAECSIIAAGEAAGRLSAAFKDSIDLMEKSSRIWKAVMAATLYPGLLGIAMIAILVVVSVFVVPRLAGISDPGAWEGAAAVLYALSEFVTGAGPYLLAAGVVLSGWIAWSFANLVGPSRLVLDRLPPWSTYRMICGASLLLNISAMLRAGVRLADALDLCVEHSTPWLRERLTAARTGISMGLNFGESLLAAGHGFPAHDAILYLRVLSGMDGFEKGLADYAEMQLEATTASTERLAKMLAFGAVLLVAGFVLMVIVAISDIQAAIEAGFI